jgi:hypothetical protein
MIIPRVSYVAKSLVQSIVANVGVRLFLKRMIDYQPLHLLDKTFSVDIIYLGDIEAGAFGNNDIIVWSVVSWSM